MLHALTALRRREGRIATSLPARTAGVWPGRSTTMLPWEAGQWSLLAPIREPPPPPRALFVLWRPMPEVAFVCFVFSQIRFGTLGVWGCLGGAARQRAAATCGWVLRKGRVEKARPRRAPPGPAGAPPRRGINRRVDRVALATRGKRGGTGNGPGGRGSVVGCSGSATSADVIKGCDRVFWGVRSRQQKLISTLLVLSVIGVRSVQHGKQAACASKRGYFKRPTFPAQCSVRWFPCGESNYDFTVANVQKMAHCNGFEAP